MLDIFGNKEVKETLAHVRLHAVKAPFWDHIRLGNASKLKKK